MTKVRFPIVGMSHHKPAPTVMSLLPAGVPLYLELEPSNQYDPNAIKVWIEDFSAHTDSEGIEAVQHACISDDMECPALDQPLFLGYIKAKSIDDAHQGADILSPRILEMISSGIIQSEREIPCELYYGTSGRPSLVIKVEGEAEGEDAGGETLEAPANETTTEEAGSSFDSDGTGAIGQD